MEDDDSVRRVAICWPSDVLSRRICGDCGEIPKHAGHLAVAACNDCLRQVSRDHLQDRVTVGTLPDFVDTGLQINIGATPDAILVAELPIYEKPALDQ